MTATPLTGAGGIACLGECMIELIERPDGSLTRGYGGDTLNTAIYLVRLGIETDYVTALGDDPFSDAMLASWQAEGVGTQSTIRIAGAVPGLYLIQTTPDGERRFTYWRTNAPVRRLFAIPETPALETWLARRSILYLSGITLSLFDDPSRARLFACLDQLRANGGTVVFDTNFRPRGWPNLEVARSAYRAMLNRTDLVLAGMEDFTLLWQGTNAEAATACFKPPSVRELVLKCPDLACRITTETETHTIPTRPVPAIDTTAAGDSFAAAYLAARLHNHPPPQAAIAAHRLAGTVIRHPGAIIPRDAMPNPGWDTQKAASALFS